MSSVPVPPFKASKKVALVMYPLWCGRITVEEAVEKARALGFSEESMEGMIEKATAPSSYWSQQQTGDREE
jgi:hypothetical protein